MTTAAERVKAAHRGFRQAAPASASRQQALDHHGLRYAWTDDYNVVVEGRYQFNLVGSHWYLIEDPARHGYTVVGLVADIEKFKKPAAGRDSDDGVGFDPDTHTEAPSIAESAAGPVMPAPRWEGAEGSASLLPAVTP